VADVRLIIDPPSPGDWNMAVDEVLLMDAVDNGNATLRFYQWNDPTLSLGYFQPFADRKQHAASRNCAIVRRQSGGGAILHDHELTYSFVLPPADPLTRDAPHLYNAVHAAFIAALSKLSGEASASPSLKCRGNQILTETPDEPFLCFQRQSPGDVIFTPPADSAVSRDPPRKVLGSAQRRHRGAILQHGSLLLAKSASAPELDGLADLIGRVPSVQELITALGAELEFSLKISLASYQMSAELQSKAADLSNNKYGSLGWTNRR
jgi:lipoyl(octanoyl) transferase